MASVDCFASSRPPRESTSTTGLQVGTVIEMLAAVSLLICGSPESGKN